MGMKVNHPDNHDHTSEANGTELNAFHSDSEENIPNCAAAYTLIDVDTLEVQDRLRDYSFPLGEPSQANDSHEVVDASLSQPKKDSQTSTYDDTTSGILQSPSDRQLGYCDPRIQDLLFSAPAAQLDDHTEDPQSSDDDAHSPPLYATINDSASSSPTWGPYQPSELGLESTPSSFSLSSSQHSQLSSPTLSEIEDGNILEETRVSGILPALLALYALPAVTLDSRGTSPISTVSYASSADSNLHSTSQPFSRPELRKRHDSLVSDDGDFIDPDDPRETGVGLNIRDGLGVTAVVKRQKYILKLANALLHFGAPSHRIESQLVATSRALGVEAHFFQLPNLVICTFSVNAKASQTHFVKAFGHIMLGKLHHVHKIYRMVCHDEISAETGTIELCGVLKSPPIYGFKTRVALAFLSAATVCVMAFAGNLVEVGLAGLCGGILAVVQLFTARWHSVYSDVFEISTAVILSFVARLLSGIPGDKLCYESISSSSIVLILPGDLILTSSLELASKNMLCGSVRMVYAIIFSLFLGFGLTLGSDFGYIVNFHLRREVDVATQQFINSVAISGNFTSENVTSDIAQGSFTFTNVSQAVASHIIKGCYRDPEWPWYYQPFPMWTLLISVPLYTFLSTSWSLQPWKSKQLPAMILISCCSYAANTFANRYIFTRSDIVSSIGAFVVGILGNMYSRTWGGTAFTAMLPGVLTLIPDGIAAAGGFTQNYRGKDADQYAASVLVGLRMVQVAIGITVGLFASGLVVYSVGHHKKNALFAF